jgi:hypothetical protein
MPVIKDTNEATAFIRGHLTTSVDTINWTDVMLIKIFTKILPKETQLFDKTNKYVLS